MKDGVSPERAYQLRKRAWIVWVLVAVGCWLGAASARAADVQPLTSWTTGLSGPDRNTSGTDRLLIFTAGAERGGNPTISSATYGGQALTQVVTATAGGSTKAIAYIFYLDEAGIQAATSNTFSVSWSQNPTNVSYAARIYENVDQSAPIRDSDSAATSSSSPNPITTPALTVVDGDYVVAAAECGNAQSYSWNNGFIEGTDQQESTSDHSTADKAITADGSEIASATNNNPNRQAILGAVLKNSSPPAAPETYYVRPDGNNGNTGDGPSAAEAWATVAYATTAGVLNPGDLVYVMSGTYTGPINPSVDGTSTQPIRFIADTDGSIFGTAGNVVLATTSNNEVIDMDNDDYLEFVGFHIDGSAASSQQAVELDDCDGIAFEKCVIFDAASDGVDADNSSLTLINCLIYDNSSRGIDVRNGSTVTVWNSTIAHNGSDGIATDSGTTTVRNSILAYNSDDGFDRNGGTLTHSYNLVYNNSSNNFEGTSQGTGELTSDPNFSDTASRDYHLQGGSAAIDAGTSASGTVDNDLDDISRPIGLGWDMGCYEYALLGHWAFDEGSGTSVADSSGNGNDGTLMGGAGWEAAQCNQTVTLDGSSQWVDLGQIDLETKAYTVSAWFKTSTAAQQTIFAATATSTTDHALFVELDAQGRVQLVHRSPAASSGGTTLTSSDTYNNGTWHHVAAVKSTTELRLYVDGELVDSVSDTTSVHSSVDVVLGRFGVSLSQRYLTGSIDEVRLYGSALSATDVAAMTGLIGRWRLDESSGTTAADSSVFGHTGTLSSGFTFDSSSVANSKVAQGLQFDGSGDYISVANTTTLQVTDRLTISAWIKGDAWDSGGSVNIVARKGEGNPNNYQLAIADGQVAFYLDDSDTSGYRGDTVLPTKVWYHVAATWDGSEVRVYVNGVMDHATPYSKSAPIGTDTRSLYIGGRSGADLFQGVIDDVRIYDRALCGDEIADLTSGGEPTGIRVIKWLEVQ